MAGLSLDYQLLGQILFEAPSTSTPVVTPVITAGTPHQVWKVLASQCRSQPSQCQPNDARLLFVLVVLP